MQSSDLRPLDSAFPMNCAFRVLVAAVCLGLFLPMAAAAAESQSGDAGAGTLTPAERKEEERRKESRRFAIGLSLTSGVFIGQQNGQVIPGADLKVIPNADPNNPCACVPRPPAAYGWPFNVESPPGSGNFGDAYISAPEPFGKKIGSDLLTVSPNFGASLDIMTPALEFVPFRPRLFAIAEILPTFASNITLALDGAATDFILRPTTAQPINYPASAIAGLGTRLDSQVMTTMLAASVGLAFDFTFRERLIRLRPGVGWIRWGILATGKVLDAYKDDPSELGVIPLIPPLFGQNIRLVQLEGRGAAFFNGLGPTLEVEMELQKRGSFRPSLYLTGGAFRTIGNDSLTFSATTSRDDALGQADYTAEWVVKVVDWNYRAGLGFRIRWVGL